MGDLPVEWELVRHLPEGGQAHTFVVRRAQGLDDSLYVLKRLKNPKREDYFEREIQACETLDHPNVLRVRERGRTPKGKPYLITEYCSGGSIEGRARFENPGDGLRFFEQIVAGVAHAHAHQAPIYHLDLKPENVLLRDGVPVVADFGICYIEDDQVSFTREGPRGSMYYCAPELRNPKIASDRQLMAADVYSLGKILYWLFTHDVYDGHDEEYSQDESKRLARMFPSFPQFAFVDQLVDSTVRRNPADRLQSAMELAKQVSLRLERLDGGGRVLDLRVPQRCLYCGAGYYRPVHETYRTSPSRQLAKFPKIEDRRNPPQSLYGSPVIYTHLREAATAALGLATIAQGIPLVLVCDYCGNVQFFRFDLTPDQHGENWLP